MSSPQLDALAAALPAYEIGRELGRGGWGVVLEGKHRQLGREVAIKQLPTAVANDPDVRARFAAEARLLASLDHPHIVPVYDYVESQGLCLLVMEKLTGGTLWQRFTSTGVGPEQACATILAVLAGLDFAHERGILHRDIKPENIMFSAQGVVKVADFGIAKVVGGNDVMVTQAGEVVGTPAYMAPEQAQAQELGPWTDVYAVAVMLYELLSGRLPFPDTGEPLALLYQHVFEDPPHLYTVAPQIPPDITAVVMRALVRAPAERYQNSEQFGVALAEAATAAWGTGWPTIRGQVSVMAGGPIIAATERPSGQLGAVSADPNAAPTAVAQPLSTQPRLTVAQAPVRRAPVNLSQANLRAVSDVSAAAPPTLQTVAALALAVITVILGFVGLGSKRSSTSPGFSLVSPSIGVPKVAGDPTELDFSKPINVSLAQKVPAGAAVKLSFTSMGVPLGEAKGVVPAGGTIGNVPLDPKNLEFSAAGEMTAHLKVAGVATEFLLPVKADKTWATIPGAATIGLLLAVIAYAESYLRSLRHGRRGGGALVGMGVVGALFGLDVRLVAWMLGGKEPAVAGAVACAVAGAAAGVAAAMAGIQLGKRKRFRPSAAR